MGWAQVVQKHNDEFNDSGRVAKRRSDVPVEQLLAYCILFFSLSFSVLPNAPLPSCNLSHAKVGAGQQAGSHTGQQCGRESFGHNGEVLFAWGDIL